MAVLLIAQAQNDELSLRAYVIMFLVAFVAVGIVYYYVEGQKPQAWRRRRFCLLLMRQFDPKTHERLSLPSGTHLPAFPTLIVRFEMDWAQGTIVLAAYRDLEDGTCDRCVLTKLERAEPLRWAARRFADRYDYWVNTTPRQAWDRWDTVRPRAVNIPAYWTSEEV